MPGRRAMRPSILRPSRAPSCWLALLVVTVALGAKAQEKPDAGSLREKYPVSSIDSAGRADAALAETNGAKAHIQLEYRNQARDCARTFAVNTCLEQARALQRKRLADIEGVELEANRFKRRDQADRIEAGRAKREAERAANAPADSDLRARNRRAFDERQSQVARETAARKGREAGTADSPKGPRKSAIKAPPPADSAANMAMREKIAIQHASKLKEAAAHQDEIDRRVAVKTAERKRHADERAAKDAKAAALPAKSLVRP